MGPAACETEIAKQANASIRNTNIPSSTQQLSLVSVKCALVQKAKLQFLDFYVLLAVLTATWFGKPAEQSFLSFFCQLTRGTIKVETSSPSHPTRIHFSSFLHCLTRKVSHLIQFVRLTKKNVETLNPMRNFRFVCRFCRWVYQLNYIQRDFLCIPSSQSHLFPQHPPLHIFYDLI